MTDLISRLVFYLNVPQLILMCCTAKTSDRHGLLPEFAMADHCILLNSQSATIHPSLAPCVPDGTKLVLGKFGNSVTIQLTASNAKELYLAFHAVAPHRKSRVSSSESRNDGIFGDGKHFAPFGQTMRLPVAG